MRHGKKHNHLGRKKGHRVALLRNMSIALIEHKRINTTLAKAKALRRFIEPFITKAKTNTTHSRRVVFSNLQSKNAVIELFGPIAAKVGDRPGGYTRIIRTDYRKGDGAQMAMIELVDYNEVYQPAETRSSSKRTRRGSSGSSSGDSSQASATAANAAISSQEEE